MILTRRRALWGLFAAPAIVRASSLMAIAPVRPSVRHPALVIDLGPGALNFVDVRFETAMTPDGPWKPADSGEAAVREAMIDQLIYGRSWVRLRATAQG